MPFTYIREFGQSHGLGQRLMAVVVDGDAGRVYVSPSKKQTDAAFSACPEWEPTAELPENPRDFKTPNYGMRTFGSLFTKRQLTSHTTFAKLISEVRKEIVSDAEKANFHKDGRSLDSGGTGHIAYSDALATYLTMVVDRMIFYGSSLCGWLAKDNAMGQSMPKQALAMSWDFAEGNPFGKSSAHILACTRAVADCVYLLESKTDGEIKQFDACEIEYPNNAVISTDPPYYDNFGYAELSDYFYSWLKYSLSDIYPNLFRRLVTPKEAELVATPYRHGGTDAAEAFFMHGMSVALTKMQKASDNYPTIVCYAFKQQEQSDTGTSSAGWATFLQAIVNAGFSIDGTWPVRTENPSRSIAQGANALASSIVLVCRKRSKTADIVTRADFIRALKKEMPGAIDAIRKAGVGPVDMQQSVIGPGMGVYSRHSKVLEDDDSAMSVKTALEVINRVWEEIENELDQAFDPETQVALAW